MILDEMMDRNPLISNKAKGDSAEAIAVAYLEQNGFFVIEMNHRNKHGEIDIIATKPLIASDRFARAKKKGEVLETIYHFIEVKMRVKDAYGRGAEAVTQSKQKRIRTAAQYYMIENRLHDAYYSSFDVIEINGWFNNYELEFFENCF